MKNVYKILVSLLILLLLIAAIFFFSEQPGSASHSESMAISKRIAHVWSTVFWDEKSSFSETTLASMLNGPVRKLAHIIIYTVLGSGACIVVHILKGKNARFIHLFFALLLVFIVACFDEYNQFTSGGRGASFTDVCIDSFGGMIGIYLVYMIKDFVRHLKNGINREKKK